MTVSHAADIFCAYCSARGEVHTDDGLLCVGCYEANSDLVEVEG
jgi:hypothetical protein